MERAAASLMALLLVSSLLAAVVPLSGVGGAAAEECSEVEHTAFRTGNSTLSELNQSGSASATQHNVPVRVEDTDSFVRLAASNPNGYPVCLYVEISQEVVTAAELGEVEAVEPEGSNLTADWSAMHSLEEDELYTEVAIRLPAGQSEVVFAPSKLRVQTLSWTGDAEGAANGTLSRIWSGISGSEGKAELQQREYILERNESGSVTTLSLTGPDGERVEEWHASYKTEGGQWTPIGQDSTEPVYYVEANETLRLYYNKPAKVRFTAEPTVTEKMQHEILSYQRSWSSIFNIELPFSTAPGLSIAELIGGGA